MSDKIETLKKNLHDGLRSLGFEKLIEIDCPKVPLWKYLFKQCKTHMLFLLSLMLSMCLQAHKLLSAYSHYDLIYLVILWAFIIHVTYKMFEHASYFRDSEFSTHAFKIALNQCTDAYINGSKECRERTKRMIEEFGYIPEEHEHHATILPFKKPTDEPKLN